jgi:pimeloyl-ACP methyl ester carboxylesterase
VFAVDVTGYGRSTRPAPMNEPCNLSPAQQARYVPALIAAPCAPSLARPLTTIQSDWNDIDAAVDYVRALRGVQRVSLLGWSLGGPRSAGYAAKHPEKVRSIVLLAPAYNRTPRAGSAGPVAAFNTQSREDFVGNWDRQTGCPGQYEESVRDAVWKAMLESDPVGATWGGGARRAPTTALTGWTPELVSTIRTPVLLVAAAHDAQVLPARVKEFYEDLGTKQKMLIDLGCSSHNALWEKNRMHLFAASLEWLTKGTVNGADAGTLRLGY